jgi:hypothetical protein
MHAADQPFSFFDDGPPLTVVSSRERVFLPRWLTHDNHPIVMRHRKLEYYRSLLDFCQRRNPRTICLYRTYALGDILMLLPLARRLRKLIGMQAPILIVVQDRFMRTLGRPLRGWNEVAFREKHVCGESFDYGCDVHMNLDGVLEPDHWGGEESNHHRCVLYARVLGLEIDHAQP